MTQKLFSEFKTFSQEEIRAQIDKDLKGADFDTLYWKSLEGVITKPIYENLESTKINGLYPDKWQTVFTIEVELDIEDFLKRCKNAIKNDVEVLFIRLLDKRINLNDLFSVANAFSICIYFEFYFIPEFDGFQVLPSKFLRQSNRIVLFDPITCLATSGNWIINEEADISFWKYLQERKTINTPIYVDMRVYQNAGATITQQLAFGVSHAVDYLSWIDTTITKEIDLLVNISLGSNYFFEIAKIQAFKNLIERVSSVYEFKINLKVLTEPSKRNMTVQDYNMNMIRSTASAMAAIVGGADLVSNLPYDTVFNKPNEFGDRIAQNQLLILKHESFFDKISNAAEGSYYITQLVEEFSTLGLEQFKELEKDKGLLVQLLEGKIQEEVLVAAKKEEDLFESGELVLVGINKFKDPKAVENLKEQKLKTIPKNTKIKPLLPCRLSEKTEDLHEK